MVSEGGFAVRLTDDSVAAPGAMYREMMNHFQSELDDRRITTSQIIETHVIDTSEPRVDLVRQDMEDHIDNVDNTSEPLDDIVTSEITGEPTGVVMMDDQRQRDQDPLHGLEMYLEENYGKQFIRDNAFDKVSTLLGFEAEGLGIAYRHIEQVDDLFTPMRKLTDYANSQIDALMDHLEGIAYEARQLIGDEGHLIFTEDVLDMIHQRGNVAYSPDFGLLTETPSGLTPIHNRMAVRTIAMQSARQMPERDHGLENSLSYLADLETQSASLPTMTAHQVKELLEDAGYKLGTPIRIKGETKYTLEPTQEDAIIKPQPVTLNELREYLVELRRPPPETSVADAPLQRPEDFPTTGPEDSYSGSEEPAASFDDSSFREQPSLTEETQRAVQEVYTNSTTTQHDGFGEFTADYFHEADKMIPWGQRYARPIAKLTSVVVAVGAMAFGAYGAFCGGDTESQVSPSPDVAPTQPKKKQSRRRRRKKKVTPQKKDIPAPQADPTQPQGKPTYRTENGTTYAIGPQAGTNPADDWLSHLTTQGDASKVGKQFTDWLCQDGNGYLVQGKGGRIGDIVGNLVHFQAGESLRSHSSYEHMKKRFVDSIAAHQGIGAHLNINVGSINLRCKK